MESNKRYKSENTIGRPDLQKFVGALSGLGANGGVFITTSSFSNEAKANVNGTQYRSCIVNIGGENYFAKLWEKSVSKAVIGTEYNIEAVVDGDNLWLTCLTGVSATIATPATFAALLAEL